MPTAKFLLWSSLSTCSVGLLAAEGPGAQPLPPLPSATATTTTTTTTVSSSAPTPAPGCVTALPRIAGLARATLNSQCGSRDGVVHNGDAIALQARGHFRLEARLDTGSLEVTCVSSNEPVVATIGDGQAPWFHLDGDAVCGGWSKNEQVCARGGTEVLVCDAATQQPRAPIAARPLGLPAWYVHETEAVPEAAPGPASPEPAPTAPKVQRLLRVVMQEPQAVGVDGSRLLPIFARSLTTELRKLRGVTVVSMDELRALIDQEEKLQLSGCTDESCLGEIANALDADEIITAQLGESGGEQTLAMRRLSTNESHATGDFDVHFASGNGEGFLGAVGPAVAKLFPDHELRNGETRGVDREAAYLLNPPPVAPWVFYATVGVGAVAAAGAAGVGAFTVSEVARIDDRLARSTVTVVDGGGLVDDHDRAVAASAVAWGALGTSAVVLVGALVLLPFTDFDGYQTQP